MLNTSGVPNAYPGPADATVMPAMVLRRDPLGRTRMDLIEIPVEGYEQVIRCHDAHSGLNAIISIHNTAPGPALGGMRMWPYATLHEALLDANRLAQGMTYKS